MTPYRRPMPLTWWLGRRAYVLFILRESTSVFIAVYLVGLLILLQRLAAGRDAYESYLRALATPWAIGFHLLALAAALFHTATWLRLAPAAVVVRLRGQRVPPAAIVGVNVAIWLIVSIVIAWIVIRG